MRVNFKRVAGYVMQDDAIMGMYRGYIRYLSSYLSSLLDNTYDDKDLPSLYIYIYMDRFFERERDVDVQCQTQITQNHVQR